jgi:hypothetical protein
MLDDLNALADQFPARPVQRIHVGEAILAWFRNLPKAPIRYGDPFASWLSSIPIVYDKDLHAGAWQGKDRDGEVVASGQIGDPDRPVWYVPGTGFVTWTGPDLVADTWWL